SPSSLLSSLRRNRGLRGFYGSGQTANTEGKEDSEDFLQTVWNSLQKVTKARKEACIPRNANSNFVFLAAFCTSFHRCIHFMRRQTNSAPKVIVAAIEVHREKGPGLIESSYERCTLPALELRL